MLTILEPYSIISLQGSEKHLLSQYGEVISAVTSPQTLLYLRVEVILFKPLSFMILALKYGRVFQMAEKVVLETIK